MTSFDESRQGFGRGPDKARDVLVEEVMSRALSGGRAAMSHDASGRDVRCAHAFRRHQ